MNNLIINKIIRNKEENKTIILRNIINNGQDLTVHYYNENGEEEVTGVYKFNKDKLTMFKIGIYKISYACEKISNVITSNFYSPSSLYKKYSSDTKLLTNNLYTIELAFNKNSVGLENISKKFYSEISPMLTSIDKIKNDCDKMAENFSDELIYKSIYYKSKEVMDIYKELNKDNYSVEAKIPLYLNQVCRYRVDIDLTHLLYLNISSNYGGIYKKMGTLEIKEDIKMPNLNYMMRHFQELLDPYEKVFLKKILP